MLTNRGSEHPRSQMRYFTITNFPQFLSISQEHKILLVMYLNQCVYEHCPNMRTLKGNNTKTSFLFSKRNSYTYTRHKCVS